MVRSPAQGGTGESRITSPCVAGVRLLAFW